MWSLSKIRGPLFDGAPSDVVRAALEDVTESVAHQGSSIIKAKAQKFNKSGRGGTGAAANSVTYRTKSLTAIVAATSILTGPVDILIETQPELLMPMVIVSVVSEAQRTVPQGARDTQVQIDIWSRNSQLEIENIYEEILNVLSFQIANQGQAHIFWDRLGGATDLFEADRRVWHRACTFTFWSIKP